MNEESLREDLDLVKEVWTKAALWEASLKQRIAIQYDAKVIRREFEVGILVLKRNHKESHEGKLAEN